MTNEITYFKAYDFLVELIRHLAADVVGFETGYFVGHGFSLLCHTVA